MRLTTRTTGSGPLHVGLVHGLGADGATWSPFADLLLATGRYTVTVLDLRGHGSSPRAASYGLDELADDVVESLPTGLDGVVGHSLGGSVLVRAVGRLAPARAVYLDPGFHLSLPTAGIGGRLFWAAPTVSLGLAQLLQARRSAKARAAYPPEVRVSLDSAHAAFDRSMAVGVFRDVAFHPVGASAPDVPSTVVLSDDSAAVLPDDLADRLTAVGWEVVRLPGVHHDMQLEAPDRTARVVDEALAR